MYHDRLNSVVSFKNTDMLILEMLFLLIRFVPLFFPPPLKLLQRLTDHPGAPLEPGDPRA